MRITIAAAIVALVIVSLFKSGVINALLMFVMIGAMPGTGWVLPPMIMLALVIIIAWLALLQSTIQLLRRRRI